MGLPGAAPHWRVPRSPRRLMLAVLLLHGAALLGLQWASRPLQPSAAPPQRLLLRWIAEPRPSPPEAAREEDTSARAERPPEHPPLGPPPVRPEQPIPPDLATTVPAPLAPQAITTAPALPLLPPEPAASHPPPLRLELPRPGRAAPGRAPEVDPSPAGQAARDPRSNSSIGRGNPVERALDAGPTAVTEEDRGDGRRRYRVGRDCVDLREGRAAGLDPFSASTRPVPKLADSCR